MWLAELKLKMASLCHGYKITPQNFSKVIHYYRNFRLNVKVMWSPVYIVSLQLLEAVQLVI